MNLKISPSFTIDKLRSGQIEDKIDVYEDRVLGWFLRPARSLLSVPNSEFALLQLTIGYFEGYAIYRNGQDSTGHSKVFFRQAFLDVFPFFQTCEPGMGLPSDLGQGIADALYEGARCGLFHDGMARSQILLAKASAPITVSAHKTSGDLGVVVIDVEKFLDNVEVHFVRYVAKLRAKNNTQLRGNFETAWNLKHPGKIYPLAPGGIP